MKKLILILFLLLFAGCAVKSEELELFGSPIKEEYTISCKQGNRDKIIEDGEEIASGTFHNAIDIPCKNKTKVYASKSGRVVTVYPSYYNGEKWKGHPIYGGLIEIEHNDGTMTRYAHLSLTEVSEGMIVEKGQEIGWSGGVKGRRGSGQSTGPHLHFEIILNIENWLEK